MAKYEGEQVQVITTDAFLDSLDKLNINDFSDVDLKCLVKVLEKPQLNKWIQLQDLAEILENFGVKEYQETKKESEANDGETSDNNDPRKKKKRILNYDMLRKDSLNFLALFTDYLLDTDTSVYEFFDGIIYNQVVRTK